MRRERVGDYPANMPKFKSWRLNDVERFLIGRNQKRALTLLNCRIFCAEVATTSAENALAELHRFD